MVTNSQAQHTPRIQRARGLLRVVGRVAGLSLFRRLPAIAHWPRWWM